MDPREISFITELKIQVKHECPVCHEYKLNEYLVMDDQGDMFSVCKECGAHLLKLTNGT